MRILTDEDCPFCAGNGYGDNMAYSFCNFCGGSGLKEDALLNVQGNHLVDNEWLKDKIYATLNYGIVANAYCITKWGARLLVEERVSKNIFRVSDPNSVDAGQCISTDEIVLIAKIKK